MAGIGDVSLGELKAQIEAAANNVDALKRLDGLLVRRPEPEARKLRLKIGSLRRAARQVVAQGADVAATGNGGVCEKVGWRVPPSDPAARSRPREAARVPSGPWRAILDACGLERPDGRPLHRYRLDQGSFLKLQTFVCERGRRGLDHPESDLPALFVLWAAHWFQRGYRGGIRRWEDVAAAIDLPLTGQHGRTLTCHGLAAWSRPPMRGEGMSRWLATLAVEGGFPLGVLEDPNGWAGRYLEHVVATLLARGINEEEAAFATAVEQSALAPSAYRQEIFYAVAADLVLAIVRLRREVEGQELARDIPPSAWLDATRPDWRDRLPVPAGSEAAAHLVDGLLRVEARALRGTVGCDRVLRRRRDASGTATIWSVGVRLHLDGLMPSDALQALGRRRDRLRAVPSGRFARHVAGELALLEPPGDDVDEGWRSRRSRPDPFVFGIPLSVSTEVELLSEGHMVHQLCWPGGERVHGELCVFAADDAGDGDSFTLLGTGPGGYAPERIVVVAPEGWSLDAYGDTSTVEPLLGTFDKRFRIWSVQGGAIARSPENDKFCILTGQAGARRDRLAVNGARPMGFMVEEDDVEAFCGLPTWRVIDGGIGRDATVGEVSWRPSGERAWRSFKTSPTLGRVDLGWRDVETGFLRDRRRLFLLPAGAALSRLAIRDGMIYTPENLPSDAFSAADPALTLTYEAEGMHARFSDRPSRVARMRLALGEGRPLAVVAPHPAGFGFASWSGECVPGSGAGVSATSLVLSQLRGLVAYADGPDILFASVLDRDRQPVPGGQARWAFRDELPLRGAAEDIEAILSQQADIDAFAELYLQGAGRYWRVRQFEGALVVRRGVALKIEGVAGDDDIAIFGRPVATPEIEVALGVSMGAERRGVVAPELEARPGAHITYLRRGDDVVTRPTIVVLGQDEAQVAAGLAAAVRLRDAAEREEAILDRLSEIAAGAPGTQEDVVRLAALCSTLGSLPPACFDPLRLLPRLPAAAARVALSAGRDAPAVIGISERLPFLWCMLPAAAWKAAGKIELAALESKFEVLGPSGAELARSTIKSAGDRLADADPTLVLPLVAAGILDCERLYQGEGRRKLREAAQDHIRRHGEVQDEAGGETSRFRLIPELPLPSDFDVFSTVHLETLDAPCAAAAAAAGRVDLDADAVRLIKAARRNDPTYFLEAFEARFVELQNGNCT